VICTVLGQYLVGSNPATNCQLGKNGTIIWRHVGAKQLTLQSNDYTTIHRSYKQATIRKQWTCTWSYPQSPIPGRGANQARRRWGKTHFAKHNHIDYNHKFHSQIKNRKKHSAVSISQRKKSSFLSIDRSIH
jgi:hypothetical protein